MSNRRSVGVVPGFGRLGSASLLRLSQTAASEQVSALTERPTWVDSSRSKESSGNGCDRHFTLQTCRSDWARFCQRAGRQCVIQTITPGSTSSSAILYVVLPKARRVLPYPAIQSSYEHVLRLLRCVGTRRTAKAVRSSNRPAQKKQGSRTVTIKIYIKSY